MKMISLYFTHIIIGSRKIKHEAFKIKSVQIMQLLQLRQK